MKIIEIMLGSLNMAMQYESIVLICNHLEEEIWFVAKLCSAGKYTVCFIDVSSTTDVLLHSFHERCIETNEESDPVAVIPVCCHPVVHILRVLSVHCKPVLF